MNDFLRARLDRKSFLRRVDASLRSCTASGQSLAVLFLDFDCVKSVNALHGRQVVDELLELMSLRLARAVGFQGSVSRLGADKFACLLLNPSDLARIETFARHLSNTVSAGSQIGALELAITPSIGIVFSPPVDANASTILRWAVAARHRARREYQRYVFHRHRTRTPFAARLLSMIHS